jgi:acyl-CoA synthetase (NDP forming)
MQNRARTPRRTIEALLAPQSVAVVGASDSDPTKAGIIANFSAVSFAGRLYPVNPRRDTIAGLVCFPSLDALPEVPDLVVVALGASRAVDAVRTAGALGVKAAIVFDGGFADADAVGSDAQEELAAVANEYEMALLGPNCQGVVNFIDASATYLLAVEPGYRAGSIALISHSGSVTDALANNLQGVGWSHIISTGNEAGVTMADLLENLVEQESVRGVCLFIESIRDPERFFRACRRARELAKPVIVLKAGRTETAQAAALAHTGALASPDRLFDALFKTHGVIRVNSMDELLVAASITQAGRIPESGRLGVVLGSGGLVELMHDAAGGVTFPEFDETTVAALAQCTGPWVRRVNPLDFWPTDDLVANHPLMLQAVAEDPNVDVVVEVTQHSMLPTGTPGMMGVYGEAAAALAQKTSKPVVVVAPLAGESAHPKIIREYAKQGVALVSGLDQTLAALDGFAGWARHTPVSAGESARFLSLPVGLSGFAGGFSGATALTWMGAAGFDVARFAVAASSEEACLAAREIGYPVTLKIGDDEVLHKTELGGVVVGIADDEGLRSVADKMLATCSKVLVQETVRGPMTELILGVNSDPTLGRFIVVGLGGIWTEVLDDAAVRPVGEVDVRVAEEMLRELKGFSSIAGARGQEERSLEAAVAAILRLDAIASAVVELSSVDLNPVMLTPTRAIVVDALIEHRLGRGGSGV